MNEKRMSALRSHFKHTPRCRSMALLTLVCTLITACSNSKKDASQKFNPANSYLSKELAQERAQRVSEIHYDLYLDLDKTGLLFNGKTKISFQLSDTKTPLRIDFTRGHIHRTSINGKSIHVPYNGQFFHIPAHHLKLGANTVQVDYSHPYSRDGAGLYRFVDPEDQKVYLYSDFEPYDSNRMFPAFDQPDLKATYSFKVKAPKDWHVITSVREQKIENQHNFRLWHFPKSAKFSTYIISLHAGPYYQWKSTWRSKKGQRIPLRLFARQSIKKYIKYKDWFKFTKQGFNFMPKYYGYPYPYKKYDQIIAPDFNSGAMENVAAVTFSERYVSRGVKTRYQRLRLASVIHHEMAHMWFGNLVTMKWWNDLWLNESFATYTSALSLYNSSEFKEAWRDFNQRSKAWGYWEDQLVTTHPITGRIPNTMAAMSSFDGITYGKGAASLKQLAYYLGPKKFQKGIQNYFRKYAEKNTELKDFIGALGSAAKVDLTQWEKLWLQKAGLNTAKVDLTCKAGKIVQLNIIQKAPIAHPYLRPHKIKVALLSKNGQVRKAYRVKISQLSTPVPAKGQPCPAYVFPNYEDHGYIKAELDPMTVKNLTTGIHQVKAPFLRQMFWTSLHNMVIDGALPIQQYAKLALKFSPREKDIQILPSVLRHLRSGKKYLPHSTPQELQALQKYSRDIEALTWAGFQKATPRSELQKIWFQAMVASAETPKALSRLITLLEGQPSVRGLKIDQDKRWKMIYSLSKNNHPQALSWIAKEETSDRSSQGIRQSIAAKAALPNMETKSIWLTEFTKTNSEYSFSQLKTAMTSVFPPGQRELRNQYAKTYFENLRALLKQKDGMFLKAYTVLSPIECPQDRKEISNFLNTSKSLHPAVLKQLKVRRQENERCRKIMALSKKTGIYN